MKKYLHILVPVLCAAAVFLLLRTFFLVGYVPTESMEPTLNKDSYIIGCRVFDRLETGNIVIFERDGRLLVKRIAAIPGDVVERNGQSVAVPENSYYMLGDNPSNSYDSRFWADPFVARENIVAKLFFCKYQ